MATSSRKSAKSSANTPKKGTKKTTKQAKSSKAKDSSQVAVEIEMKPIVMDFWQFRGRYTKAISNPKSKKSINYDSRLETQ